jgi:uncharacterized protein with HEPN domain
MRSNRERLLDILEAIADIERYAEKGKEAFVEDELIQTWVIHHIQIIGEAASKLSPSLRENYQVIPWIDIISMRNFLVHNYFGIDLDEVWNTITTDLPNLKTRVEAMLQDLPDKT